MTFVSNNQSTEKCAEVTRSKRRRRTTVLSVFFHFEAQRFMRAQRTNASFISLNPCILKLVFVPIAILCSAVEWQIEPARRQNALHAKRVASNAFKHVDQYFYLFGIEHAGRGRPSAAVSHPKAVQRCSNRQGIYKKEFDRACL